MSGEAINFFYKFKDLSYNNKADETEPSKVTPKESGTDAAKKIELFSKTIEPAEINNHFTRKDFRDFFSKEENIKHVQEHVVELGRLVEKYEKNPEDALKDEHVKVKFSEEETKEVEKLLKDKNSLSAFLAMSGFEELSGKDVVEGLKLFNAAKKDKKMPFANMSADEIAKMDPKQFAREMRKIRRLRREMKSETVAKIAAAMARNPHRCKHYETVINKKDIYSDEAAEKAVEHMEELSDDDALTYFKNMNKLEVIKDKKTGKTKYTGDVIVDVTKDTVEEPKAANAIFETANRDDMDGYHLKGISSNLVLNPGMIPSYERMLGAKDGSGDDKFSKETLLGQTDYMSDKSVSEIESYAEKIMEYAIYDDISGEDATSYAEQAINNPSTEAEIDEMIAQIVSTEPEKLFASNKSDESEIFYTTNSVSSPFKSSFKGNSTGNTSVEEETKEAYYRKRTDNFKKKYGITADTMIELCQKNPDVVKALFTNPTITFAGGMEIIKKYGTNVDLISAIAKNPNIVDKLHGASASITSQQLTELVKLGDKKGTDFVVEILQKYGPRKTITICSAANSEASKDNILETVKRDKNGTLSDLDQLRYQRDFIA